MSSAATNGLNFVKGHGTQNDFVLLPDREGEFDLTSDAARLICDRRTGIGADGVIRVAPGTDGRYFMDYRNSDGSPSDMCGNGARVFARFLVDVGWVEPGLVEFHTRAGLRTAELGSHGDVRIAMGAVALGAMTTTTIAGRALSGRQAEVGNPHLVCLIDQDPATFDLRDGPGFDPGLFPDGVNVELARADGPTTLTMRVHERGAGETRSCGTGTVAAAAVHLAAQGVSEGTVDVQVPGGRLQVQIRPDGADLIGPAVLVYSGTLNPAVLAG